uniref:Uncharacterized protein n=1 Tax=Octopus bimaculoides TaxID=37653 RepID=A0A0L8FGZ0_OCTBM
MEGKMTAKVVNKALILYTFNTKRTNNRPSMDASARSRYELVVNYSVKKEEAVSDKQKNILTFQINRLNPIFLLNEKGL